MYLCIYPFIFLHGLVVARLGVYSVNLQVFITSYFSSLSLKLKCIHDYEKINKDISR